MWFNKAITVSSCLLILNVGHASDALVCLNATEEATAIKQSPLHRKIVEDLALGNQKPEDAGKAFLTSFIEGDHPYSLKNTFKNKFSVAKELENISYTSKEEWGKFYGFLQSSLETLRTS